MSVTADLGVIKGHAATGL